VIRYYAGFALSAVLAVLLLSCDVNEYCVTCAVDDGGSGNDGVIDAPGDTPDASDIDAAEDADLPDASDCVPSGAEACDNSDNDCDGKVDESTVAEPIPEIGDSCGADVGVCTVGTKQCIEGFIKCSGELLRGPETCNGMDDNCDGTRDEQNPGGGTTCPGQCGPGTYVCRNGSLACDEPRQPSAEVCDSADNDCDGMIDDGLTNLGPCGTETGACVAGHNECRGGGVVCIGSVGPTTEQCDTGNVDSDCDGNPSNGFDLTTDVRNCGQCGRVCNLPHAIERCTASACAVASCEAGFFDLNPNAPGCEYQCNFRGTQEGCNGQDDDCDGRIDENLGTPPAICQQFGECAAAPGRTAVVATCRGAMGWDCNYDDGMRDTSVDGNGDLIPETECDTHDNDCDGRVDESHPQRGQACNDGGQGVCRGTGTFACNTADEDGPLVCNVTSPGVPSSPETCDGLDNNCDGTVDNGANTGNLAGQNWVSIGGGRQIMKYEASRPDARAATTGTLATHACSRSGVQPWINVKQPDAEAACTSIGARLCTEEEWHRACSVVTAVEYPVPQGATGDAPIFIEAEKYFSKSTGTSGGTVRAWVPDFTAGFSGPSALRASPNTGANVSAGNAPSQSPRLDFQINFAQTGNHRIWVKLYATQDADGNNVNHVVHLGVNNAIAGATVATTITANTSNAWFWQRSANVNVATVGTKFVSLWMGHDGVKVDAIYITRSGSTAPPTDTSAAGNTWAYQNNPNATAPTTCNGDAFDTGPAAGDQDDIIATGARPQCNANWGGTNQIFDLSGNVREWTAERFPGANPIRGGASNAIEDGLRCNLAFTLADDTFFFPNVGFRCCR
jgi:hypothetical protein